MKNKKQLYDKINYYFNGILGKIAIRDIENDEQLDFTDFE